MTDIDEIKQFILRTESSVKSSFAYEKMSLEELSAELREVMTNQSHIQETINKFEERGINNDFIEYAKLVCANTSERQIKMIQESYFQKLDKLLKIKK